nr:putative integron gene cassette protein [uncultured bacterium]
MAVVFADDWRTDRTPIHRGATRFSNRRSDGFCLALDFSYLRLDLVNRYSLQPQTARRISKVNEALYLWVSLRDLVHALHVPISAPDDGRRSALSMDYRSTAFGCDVLHILRHVVCGAAVHDCQTNGTSRSL